MSVCHLFVTVMIDGYGDFSHFIDIYKAIISNSIFKEIEFIPVIHVQGTEYNATKLNKINEILQFLKVPKYFSGLTQDFSDHFHSNIELTQSLKNTDQVIFISSDTIYRDYKKYINPQAILKTINEHEGMVAFDIPNSKKRSLGLGQGCYGIKIGDAISLSSTESELIIKQNDPEFYEILLQQTGAKTLEELNQKNMIVPAYFNTPNGFIHFLTFLTTCNSDKNDSKDIALYFSGEMAQDAYFKYHFKNLIKSSNVRFETIEKNKEKIIFNPDFSRVIRIFSGYYVKDESYQALFSNAQIAGVSGDNTLECSITHKVLPFYCSTNFYSKKQTLAELKKISQLKELSIGEEARRSFDLYFDFKNFSSINLCAMIDAWPQIAAYIKTHKNFYNQLEKIVLEDLPSKKEKIKILSKTTIFFSSNSTELISDDEKALNIQHTNNLLEK